MEILTGKSLEKRLLGRHYHRLDIRLILRNRWHCNNLELTNDIFEDDYINMVNVALLFGTIASDVSVINISPKL